MQVEYDLTVIMGLFPSLVIIITLWGCYKRNGGGRGQLMEMSSTKSKIF